MRRSFIALGVLVACLLCTTGASATRAAARPDGTHALTIEPAAVVASQAAIVAPPAVRVTPPQSAWAFVTTATLVLAALLWCAARQRRRAAAVPSVRTVLRLRGPPRGTPALLLAP